MSQFLSPALRGLAPYTPGEQPQDRTYIKLNTNESPYPPSPRVLEAVAAQAGGDLRLYPDPELKSVRRAAAERYGLSPGQVFVGGGSDEILAYIFMAFFQKGNAACFADVTYSFYPVCVDLFGLAADIVPLREDFTVETADYRGRKGHVFLCNPNAPTGICLAPAQVEELLRQDPDRLVIVDEAYVDFAPGMDSLPLLGKYPNLLVVRTFSKSRSLAGMRVGLCMGSAELIADLTRVKFSFNPYNLSRPAVAAAIAALEDGAYVEDLVSKIRATRARMTQRLTEMDFAVLPSQTNFLFARTAAMGGEALYQTLKSQGILVRHFNKPRIDEFIRVTVGTDAEADAFLEATRCALFLRKQQVR